MPAAVGCHSTRLMSRLDQGRAKGQMRACRRGRCRLVLRRRKGFIGLLLIRLRSFFFFFGMIGVGRRRERRDEPWWGTEELREEEGMKEVGEGGRERGGLK